MAEFDDAPNSAEVKLTTEKPAAEVKLYLGRPGRITGSVLDEETRKPIAGFLVSAMVSSFPSASAKTDAMASLCCPTW